MPRSPRVRLYPVPGVSVYPYPSEPFDATPEEAAFLLGHLPPPFTTDPPPVTPETQPEDPSKGGSSDSEA